MLTTPKAAAQNQLLASLPPKDRQRLLAGCQAVDLQFAQVLAEPGEPILHVYFPCKSFISLIASIDDRASLEVGLIGNEGMLGSPIALGVDFSPLHAQVQGEGLALRMDGSLFKRELASSKALQCLLQRYFYVLTIQLAQTAACTRFHVIEARLARWLLMTQDRAHTDGFRVTQEFLSYMLGVRRVGVTKAATSLHKRKLISYHRGNMMILDRNGLKAASCSCYAADRLSYMRIMG